MNQRPRVYGICSLLAGDRSRLLGGSGMLGDGGRGDGGLFCFGGRPRFFAGSDVAGFGGIFYVLFFGCFFLFLNRIETRKNEH